jgi:hypothetical protein
MSCYVRMHALVQQVDVLNMTTNPAIRMMLQGELRANTASLNTYTFKSVLLFVLLTIDLKSTVCSRSVSTHSYMDCFCTMQGHSALMHCILLPLVLLLCIPGRINKSVAATDDALAQRAQAEHEAAIAAALTAAQAARQRLRAKKHRKKDEVTRIYECMCTCVFINLYAAT